MSLQTAQPPQKTKKPRYNRNTKHPILSSFKAGLDHFFNPSDRDISIGEKLILIAIIALFEQSETVTKKDVIQYSEAKQGTAYQNMKGLEIKGYLIAVRSNEYYALSFLTLTDKGNLFASRLRRILSQS